MKTRHKLLLLPALFFCFISSAAAGSPPQLGAGYGFDIRSNAHFDQYELFLRKPLSYTTTIYDTQIASAIEFGFGYIRESGGHASGAGRFSIMPEVILRPRQRFSFMFGLGAGLMAGETDLSGHRLGGPFLFTFKVGVQFHLTRHWVIEDAFYHQSNGHIYLQNYSVNTNQLSVIYVF